MFASVLLDLKLNHLQDAYDYIIPQEFIGFLEVGMRVKVPFNEFTRSGIVIEIKQDSLMASKSILSVLDLKPVISDELFLISNWIESRNNLPKALVMDHILPSYLRMDYDKEIHILKRDLLPENYQSLFPSDFIKWDKSWSKHLRKLRDLETKHILEIQDIIGTKNKIKYEKIYHIGVQPKTSKRLEIYEFVQNQSCDLATLKVHFNPSLIRQMVKNLELIESFKEIKSYLRPAILKPHVIKLTESQSKVYESIKMAYNRYERFLLNGVNASGKTEIYKYLIKDILAEGKQALVVLPNRLLANELYERFSDIEGGTLLHSGLSNQANYDAYRGIVSGEIKVVIGLQQAIFQPFHDLGIIVVDEAHDSDYLHTYNPKFDSIEILNLRAKYNHIPIVLVTATPTVNQYYDASVALLHPFYLKNAYLSYSKKILITDMKQELLKGNVSMFSEALKLAMDQALISNKQVLLLANRKGYAPFVMCRNCGYIPVCKNCGKSLTYHKKKGTLICNQCGYQETYTNSCPNCHDHKWKPVGFGLEKVEESLKELYPKQKIVTVDHSVYSNPKKLNALYEAYNKHEIDILLGTQILSKGIDLKVDVLGILLADQTLNLSSYLATEKTYLYIKQALGRIARKDDGKAIIQTYNPNHYIFNSLQNDSFYETELAFRNEFYYPPFSQMVTYYLTHLSIDKLLLKSERITSDIKARFTQYKVYGPVETEHKNTYRIVIKMPKRVTIESLTQYLKLKYQKDNLLIEVDYLDDTL